MDGRYHTLFILEIYNRSMYRLNVYVNRREAIIARIIFKEYENIHRVDV